jgi:DNA mismatch endonuclease, patch repair protein
MARVRGRDTVPELFVRSLVHRLGYRFRLQGRDLPGRPDLVFRSRRKVIFVHGCFWHSHSRCANARVPKSRHAFWANKLSSNKARDRRSLSKLTRMGWSYLVVWECDLSAPEPLAGKIIEFLDSLET